MEAEPAADAVAVNEPRATRAVGDGPRVDVRHAEAARAPTSCIRPAVAGGEFPVEKSPMNDSFLGSAVAAPPSADRQRGLAIAAAVLFVVFSSAATASSLAAGLRSPAPPRSPLPPPGRRRSSSCRSGTNAVPAAWP